MEARQDAMKKVWRNCVAGFGEKLNAAKQALMASLDKAKQRLAKSPQP